MAQDVRKTLVVLSQIKAALEMGIHPVRAMTLALESPIVSGLFSDKLIKDLIDGVSKGHRYSAVLSQLDIFSEYDQAIIQVGEDSGGLERAFDEIINQHMFIRSLGV